MPTTSDTTKSSTVRKSAPKQVQVIARVEFKNDARRVVYFVRSSDGKSEYQVSFFDGKVTACDCPAKRGCYHKTQCQEIENKRVVVKVGEQKVSGATPDHAVAKALNVVKARRTIADVDAVAQAEEVALSAECPQDAVNLCAFCLKNPAVESNVWHSGFCSIECAAEADKLLEELPELPQVEEEAFGNEPLSAEDEALFQQVGSDPIVLADEITAPEEWKAPTYSTQAQRDGAKLGGQGFNLLRV